MIFTSSHISFRWSCRSRRYLWISTWETTTTNWKTKTLALNNNKIRVGVRPFDFDTTIPLNFFALFTNFLFISWCFYSIPKRFIQKWERGVQGEKKRNENFYLSVNSTPPDGRIVPFTDVDILCTLRHPFCQKIIYSTFHFHQKSIGKLRHFKTLSPRKLKFLGSIKLTELLPLHPPNTRASNGSFVISLQGQKMANFGLPEGWIGVIISIRPPSILGILPAAGFRRFVTTAVVTLDSLFVEMQRQTFCWDAETNWCIFCTFATQHNEGIRLTTWFWGGDEPSICKCLKPGSSS